MGGQAIDAPRSNIFWIDPDDVILVGKDIKCSHEHELYDPRVHDDPDPAMVKNIIRVGVKKPILVRKVGDDIQVVDGRRRVINCREANIELAIDKKEEKRVPCMLEKGKDDELFETMIAANCFSKTPSPEQNAKMLKRFLAFPDKTEKDAAEVFGVDIKTIGNWKKMENLAPEVIEAIEKKEISATAASQLVRLPPKKQKAKLAEAKKATPKGKRVKVATIAKKAGTKNLAFVAPSKKLVKKLADVRTRVISTDFIRGARWAVGELETDKIKGLDALLKRL